MLRLDRRRGLFAFGAAMLFLILGLLRLWIPSRGLDTVGPAAVMDACFALLLSVAIILLAIGCGRLVLSRLNIVAECTSLEGIIYAFTIGLGVVGGAVLVLALLGWLRPLPILISLTVGFLLSAEELRRSLADGWRALARLRASRLSPLVLAGMVLAFSTFLLASLQALTPAWDYDGLMYHLQAPRLFLESGRLLPLPQIWQANGPMTVEMLYTIGLALRSDSIARFLHLAMTGALVLAACAGGRRLMGSAGGLLAAAIMAGIPILPIWGSLAFADAGWALFEFTAVLALLRWATSRRTPWLVLAGALAGLGMGSKYLGAGMTVTIGVLVLWLDRRRGWTMAIKDVLVFGGLATLVAAPWYLKNLAWFGNPVYPFLWGGPEWPADRVATLMAYLGSFGVGTSLLETILLPWNLYVRHADFGTFMTTIEIPSVLFPLALLFPFYRENPGLRLVAQVALLRFGFWAIGSQQIRFLLPLFPLLALLASGAMLGFYRRVGERATYRILAAGIGLGLIAVALAYQVIFFVSTRPLPVVIGSESRDSFLRRAVYDYPALRYVQTSLSPSDRVFMAWDGQGYYCDERCLPDAEQSQWAQLVDRAGTTEAITGELRATGVTHLLVDLEGMNFLLRHDPTGIHAQASRVLIEEYAPTCLAPLLATDKVALYRLDCR